MDWQPIETAPRDGTRVLLVSRFDHARVMLGFWSPDDDPEVSNGWETDTEWWPDQDFTHWAPLPSPPKE